MQIASLKVNSTLYDNGRWVDSTSIPALDDMSFHVSALDSREARRVRAERLMAMPEDKRRNLSPEQAYELNAAVIAHGVLHDWKGLADDNGPIAFAPDFAEALLANPDYRRLVDLITTSAALVQAEASVEVASAAKN